MLKTRQIPFIIHKINNNNNNNNVKISNILYSINLILFFKSNYYPLVFRVEIQILNLNSIFNS